MYWEDVVALLTVYEKTAVDPKLRDLHNHAVAELQAVHLDSLCFRSRVDTEEALDE
jgi:hypothetical protein